jgi:spermidine synthase
MLETTGASPKTLPMKRPLLFFTVLVIATCGLVYELITSTLASYLLGDSVTQFSTVIGVYLFALGIGAWLSKYIDVDLPRRFVEIELAVALVGGLSAPFLFATFAAGASFRLALYLTVTVIGTLVGLEIPLLLRILEGQLAFKELVSKVLAFDYLGALAASLLFPMVLVPKLGLVRTSLAFGLLNALVALWSTWLLASVLNHKTRLRVGALGIVILLAIGLSLGDRMTSLFEEQLYQDEIVHAESSPYQRIVVTKSRKGLSLFLNGNLQFASVDEYRYHEALVHPAFAHARTHQRVLILGGGDGLAAREVLRYETVEHVTLVDLDPAITSLARRMSDLVALNQQSLFHAKVDIVNQDAMWWLSQHKALFDVVIVDFPDPNNFSLGKLYSTAFFELLKSHLSPGAAVVIQSTSPLFARRSYWCIVKTLQASGFKTAPYHLWVPSFGEWGYVLASTTPLALQHPLPAGLRFLTAKHLPILFEFAKDMDVVDTEINRLNNQVLVRYYDDEWSKWN